MNAPVQAGQGLARPTPARAAIGLVALLLAFAAVILIPPAFQAVHPTSEPDPVMLFAVGASVSLSSAGLVAAGLWTRLRPAVAVIVYTVVFTTFIVLVKFSLGPWALYLNRKVALQEGFQGFVPVVAGAVFLLYAAVLVGLYTIHRLRLEHRLTAKATGTAGFFVVAGVFFACGAAVLVVAAFLAFPYVPLILVTPVAGSIGLALGGALLFANAAMNRAVVVRNASLLTALFWLAFLLLALYHVMWVVYLLGLISLWPLKTVTSK